MPSPVISVILVQPQMGENIGAAARAMKNFGISDLRIISPRDGWPNAKAQNMCVGAIDLINNAKIYTSIKDAISDLEYVYATTAVPRDLNKNYVLSKNLKNDIPNVRSLGIMFGRENCGLNNQEISQANKIITIDTQIDFSSLNLAHSVAVICYELFQSKKHLRSDLDNAQELATQNEMEYFYKHLFTELDHKNFFRTSDKRKVMNLKIRNLFSRIDNLSKKELQTLRGIISILSNRYSK